MGAKRTCLGSKSQREEVSIYMNSRVLKKYKSDMYTEYDSAVASGSDGSDAYCLLIAQHLNCHFGIESCQ